MKKIKRELETKIEKGHSYKKNKSKKKKIVKKYKKVKVIMIK